MYKDRVDAGKKLAKALIDFKDKNAIVLALPRGGIVTGAEVAKELNATLSLVLVRKIGHPSYLEYAIGSVAENEEPIYNSSEYITINKKWLKEAEDIARDLMKMRRELYFDHDISEPDLKDRTVIIVDDGIATGLTMKSAVMAVKNKHPKHLVVAVPVSAKDSADMLKKIVDEVVILSDPRVFLGSVGAHYEKFEQVDDDKVREILFDFNKKRNKL